MKSLYLVLAGLFLSSCATVSEVRMPFNNYSYMGERLFPVESNDTEKTFRVWCNNGTNIDRVFTVSRDSIQPPYGMGDECYVCEIVFGNKKMKQRAISPKSGYDSFFSQTDSLDLFNVRSQTDFYYNMAHRPISLYVIEIKYKDKYNQFSFRSDFPFGGTIDDSSIYGKIEQFIINEFYK